MKFRSLIDPEIIKKEGFSLYKIYSIYFLDIRIKILRKFEERDNLKTDDIGQTGNFFCFLCRIVNCPQNEQRYRVGRKIWVTSSLLS